MELCKIWLCTYKIILFQVNKKERKLPTVSSVLAIQESNLCEQEQAQDNSSELDTSEIKVRTKNLPQINS